MKKATPATEVTLNNQRIHHTTKRGRRAIASDLALITEALAEIAQAVHP